MISLTAKREHEALSTAPSEPCALRASFMSRSPTTYAATPQRTYAHSASAGPSESEWRDRLWPLCWTPCFPCIVAIAHSEEAEVHARAMRMTALTIRGLRTTADNATIYVPYDVIISASVDEVSKPCVVEIKCTGHAEPITIVGLEHPHVFVEDLLSFRARVVAAAARDSSPNGSAAARESHATPGSRVTTGGAPRWLGSLWSRRDENDVEMIAE